jgi:uncharacterized protein
MSLSMYQASVPFFIRSLGNLEHVLQRGAAHAKAKNVSDEVLLQTRLTFDMFPLIKQIQIATDTAKNSAARLAGVEAPKFDDDETTLEQVHARLARAIDYLKTLKPEQIDGSEARAVELKMRSGSQHFTGQDYLFEFAIPNLMFHCVTAYDILRTAGADIGKKDFLRGA